MVKYTIGYFKKKYGLSENYAFYALETITNDNWVRTNFGFFPKDFQGREKVEKAAIDSAYYLVYCDKEDTEKRQKKEALEGRKMLENELTILCNEVEIHVNLFDISVVDGFISDIERVYIGDNRREVEYNTLRAAHRWQIENAIMSWAFKTNSDMERRYIVAAEKPEAEKCHFMNHSRLLLKTYFRQRLRM